MAMAVQYSTQCKRSKCDYIVDMVCKMPCALVGCVKEDADDVFG